MSPLVYGILSFVFFVVFFVLLMKENKGSDGFWPFCGAALSGPAWPIVVPTLVACVVLVCIMHYSVKVYYCIFPDDED